MITLYRSLRVNLHGIAFGCVGKLTSADEVVTKQRSYIKIKVSVSGRRATMLCFNTKPHTMAAIEMGIDDYIFVTGYINVSQGLYFNVCNIILAELDKVGGPFRENAILTAINDQEPFKRFDNICRKANSECHRKASEKKEGAHNA